jgi:exosortase family protein XrtF
MVAQTFRLYRELPIGVRQFLMKSLLMLSGWLAIYHLLLKPLRFPDKQLTHLVIDSTVYFLNILGLDATSKGLWVYIGNKFTVGVADQCNGLELMVLFVGFLLAIHGSIKSKLWYIFAGTLLIYALNVLRCAGLAYMNYIDAPLTDFAHHYAFKLVIYAVIFLMWFVYSKKHKAV